MNIRYIKRKCGVMGCKNIGSFAISKINHFGNTVIICDSCLKEALEAAQTVGEPKAIQGSSPPDNPFYSHLTSPRFTERIKQQKETEQKEPEQKQNPAEQPKEPEQAEDNGENSEPEQPKEAVKPPGKYVCPNCNREFSSNAGLSSHRRACL